MDTVEAANEFLDWEVLYSNSDSESPADALDDIDPGGIIQTNCFSLDSQNQFGTAHGDDSVDDISDEADNPSWIDPGLADNSTRYLNKEPAEFQPDSGSDIGEFDDFEGRNELGLSADRNEQVGFEEIEQITEEKGENSQNLEKFYSESEGIDLSSVELDDLQKNSDMQMEENKILREGSEVLSEKKSESETDETATDNIIGNGNEKSDKIEKMGVVWWKTPIEFLKYFSFRVSPVWTISMAAAVMGFLILARKLYKMKKKTMGLQIKVTMDDKKVSQVMSSAARLNEAFSIMKRVPVIRPSLPGVGVTAWPAMNLRSA